MLKLCLLNVRDSAIAIAAIPWKCWNGNYLDVFQESRSCENVSTCIPRSGIAIHTHATLRKDGVSYYRRGWAALKLPAQPALFAVGAG